VTTTATRSNPLDFIFCGMYCKGINPFKILSYFDIQDSQIIRTTTHITKHHSNFIQGILSQRKLH
jgi:hypothetical protein